jgi:hypothetical protein
MLLENNSYLDQLINLLDLDQANVPLQVGLKFLDIYIQVF